MDTGRWVLLVAVVAVLGIAAWRGLTDGRFRGTHRVRGSGGAGPAGAGERPPRRVDSAERPDRTAEPESPARATDGTVEAGPLSTEAAGESVLAGTAYDAERGERATLLQFSSAFCAPCRAARRTLGDVAAQLPGVRHLEVDAESHLDLVRRLGILRTPTTLVLDAHGREVTRASGAPRSAQVLAALERVP